MASADHNARMCGAGGRAAEEISIVGDDNSLLGNSEVKLHVVGRGAESHFNRSCNINPVAAQSGGHVGIDVFVKMEADFPGHRLTS